jgi:hypothetical protein
MSVQNYLNDKESILFGWDIGPDGELVTGESKKVKVNKLGVTNRRVFHYKKLKGYDREYRDIPLEKISYLENAWHARNLLLLVLSGIFLIVGIGLTVNLYTLIYLIGPILLFAGIILLAKGLKQYGYIMINGDDWKFHFKHKEDISKIEEFIREVYFIKSEE